MTITIKCDAGVEKTLDLHIGETAEFVTEFIRDSLIEELCCEACADCGGVYDGSGYGMVTIEGYDGDRLICERCYSGHGEVEELEAAHESESVAHENAYTAGCRL